MATENINITLCSPRLSSGQDPNTPVILISPKPIHCPENHILIKVDRFGFSANNITYQALGEHPHFKYFEFHTPPESKDGQISQRTHGLIPVWGFGTIVESNHPKIKKGERVYGYFAPARYLLVPISPSDINQYAFHVPRPHLPADRRPYNQIRRCATDPLYNPNPLFEDLTMLYRPLFWTSYWCEDWLYSSNYRNGASGLLISSASSKTAFCLAYLVKKRISRGEVNKSTQVVGLTSKRNLGFTKNLGLYDEVLDYESFSESQVFREEKKWVYVDVAGNEDLNEKIDALFVSPSRPRLAASIVLGMTNISPATGATKEWNTNTFDGPSSPSSPVSDVLPKPEGFFMVEWLNVRQKQLSVEEITKRQARAWKELMEDCPSWVELQRVYGAEDVKAAYEKLVKEGLGPDKGLIWSLWDGDEDAPVRKALL